MESNAIYNIYQFAWFHNGDNCHVYLNNFFENLKLVYSVHWCWCYHALLLVYHWCWCYHCYWCTTGACVTTATGVPLVHVLPLLQGCNWCWCYQALECVYILHYIYFEMIQQFKWLLQWSLELMLCNNT